MPEFIPGRELSGQFYTQAVRPILDRDFPSLPHSAALIGPGSDALGYDTPRSTDHNWGPRVLLFLRDDDASRFATGISTALARQLPIEFLGFSTHFVHEGDSRVARPVGTGPINHKVKIGLLRGFLKSSLGFEPSSDLSPVDWLVTPEQGLLEVTAGPVFHDGLGQLARLRGCAPSSPTIRVTSGCIAWPVSGAASPSSRRSSAERPKWATSLARD